MKGLLVGLAVVLVIVLMVFGWVSGTYNSFVNQRMECKTQWAQVETQYQRRMDLIPNLVAAVRGYMMHEQVVFKEIADARTHYAGAVGDDKVKAAGALDSALARLMVIMENYPNLKADQTVQNLMFEMSGTENRVNVARQRYNEAAQIYDTHVQSFPSNIIALGFNFKEKPMYEAKKEAADAQVVNLEVNILK